MSDTFLSQSVGGPSALGTFTRSVDPQQLQTYLALEQAEILRLRRYNEFWRFYLGQHWQFTREGGEPLVTLNYCRRIINKIANWMVGKGMAITVPEPLRNVTLPVLEEVWKYNKQLQWLRNMALTGGVTGDVFVLVTFEQPTPQAIRINPHTQGRIRLQLLGSEQVFPTWDPLNKDTLLQVRIETLYYDSSASQALQEQMNSQQRHLHVLRFTQIITPDKIIETFQGGQPVIRDNVLGEIAMVHVANQLVPGEYYGLSDIDGLTNINREINEKVTDVSDIINYHAAPVTVIYGAKAGNLERSPKQIWSGLPSDAKVENLELGTDLAGPMNHIKFMRESFMELGSVPEGSLGKEQQISNTSGAALKLQYMPLVEIIESKTPQYIAAIQELNYYILRIKEIVDPTFVLPMDLCSNCGGRIAVVQYDDGTVRKRCYMVDPQTFQFMDPADVKIKHIRLHSFGPSIEESPMSQVEEEHNLLAPSEWDPEKSKDAVDAHNEKQQASAAATAQGGFGSPPPPPAAEYKPPQMSKAELPNEPEQVWIQRAGVDPNTGEMVPLGDPVLQTVIYTGCEAPNYLNPYETEVEFKDALPKDKALELAYFTGLQTAGFVSKEWVRERIPEIDNAEEEKKRCDDEATKTAGLAAAAGGHQPGSPGGSAAKPPGAVPAPKVDDDEVTGGNASAGGDE